MIVDMSNVLDEKRVVRKNYKTTSKTYDIIYNISTWDLANQAKSQFHPIKRVLVWAPPRADPKRFVQQFQHSQEEMGPHQSTLRFQMAQSDGLYRQEDNEVGKMLLTRL